MVAALVRCAGNYHFSNLRVVWQSHCCRDHDPEVCRQQTSLLHPSVQCLYPFAGVRILVPVCHQMWLQKQRRKTRCLMRYSMQAPLGLLLQCCRIALLPDCVVASCQVWVVWVVRRHYENGPVDHSSSRFAYKLGSSFVPVGAVSFHNRGIFFICIVFSSLFSCFPSTMLVCFCF